MRRDEALGKLKSAGIKFFRTSDAAILLGIGVDYAVHILAGLAKTGHLTKLKRGLWGFVEGIDPLVIGTWLTPPFPSYVSLQSALYLHGMVSQMPVAVYLVSPARTRVYRNAVGVFSVHHVSPDFFFGYETNDESCLKLAGPEKALLDFLYLGPAKTRLFTSLPEIELPRNFSKARAGRMISKLTSSSRRTMLRRGFEMVIRNSA